MSTQRDELAELIANAEYPNMEPPWSERKDRSPVKWYSRKYADAVIAAGWTKPRTVTTVEELHGLPLGSVIIDSDPCVLQMLEKSAIGGAEWAQPNEERIYPSGHVTLPATVLYEPTA